MYRRMQLYWIMNLLTIIWSERMESMSKYILLLRHMNQSSGYLSVSELADLLECTEKDILRALRYWKSEGLLDYLDDTPDDPSPKSTAPSPAASSGLHDVQSGYMTSSIPADSVSDSAALASTVPQPQRTCRVQRITVRSRAVPRKDTFCY